MSEKLVVFGIVTRIDLLNFIVTNRPRAASVSGNEPDQSTQTTPRTPAEFEQKQQEDSDQKSQASSVYSIERM